MVGRLLNADFEQRMEERFDRIERSIQRLDDQFGKVNEQFEKIYEQFGKVYERIAAADQRINDRMDWLIGVFTRMREDVTEFKLTQQRIPRLEERILRIESRLILGEDPPS